MDMLSKVKISILWSNYHLLCVNSIGSRAQYNVLILDTVKYNHKAPILVIVDHKFGLKFQCAAINLLIAPMDREVPTAYRMIECCHLSAFFCISLLWIWATSPLRLALELCISNSSRVLQVCSLQIDSPSSFVLLLLQWCLLQWCLWFWSTSGCFPSCHLRVLLVSSIGSFPLPAVDPPLIRAMSAGWCQWNSVHHEWNSRFFLSSRAVLPPGFELLTSLPLSEHGYLLDLSFLFYCPVVVVLSPSPAIVQVSRHAIVSLTIFFFYATWNMTIFSLWISFIKMFYIAWKICLVLSPYRKKEKHYWFCQLPLTGKNPLDFCISTQRSHCLLWILLFVEIIHSPKVVIIWLFYNWICWSLLHNYIFWRPEVWTRISIRK